MNKLYMHSTTFRYLVDNPDIYKAKQQVMITAGKPFAFNGIDIVINDQLRKTINETPLGSWVFPGQKGSKKEPFITYETNDESWCRYFGIGHEARGLIWGEVIGIDDSFFNIMPMKHSTVFTLERMGYK